MSMSITLHRGNSLGSSPQSKEEVVKGLPGQNSVIIFIQLKVFSHFPYNFFLDSLII